MTILHSECISPDEDDACSAQYLLEESGLSVIELEELIDNAVIIPLYDVTRPRIFSLQSIVIAHRARRLRDDFELDLHGMVLALTLICRNELLQQELDRLRAFKST